MIGENRKLIYPDEIYNSGLSRYTSISSIGYTKRVDNIYLQRKEKDLDKTRKTVLDRLKILGQIGDTGIYFKHTPDRIFYNLTKDSKNIDSKLEKNVLYVFYHKLIQKYFQLIWLDLYYGEDISYLQIHILILKIIC